MTKRPRRNEPAPDVTAPAIVWFREDLRLHDNPALRAAVATKRPILAIFVLDERHDGPRSTGGAARWWLHGALEDLAGSLAARGAELLLYVGNAQEIVLSVVRASKAAAVFWNRRYERGARSLDDAVEQSLKGDGVAVETFNGKLLGDPEQMRTKAGTPFRMYAPFLRTLSLSGEPPPPLPAPRAIPGASRPIGPPKSVTLEALRLLPHTPDWAGGLRQTWTPGETDVRKRLGRTVAGRLPRYTTGRDRPADDATTRLSPHLAAGELSSRQVWHAAHAARTAKREVAAAAEKFWKELAWRDFSYHLLFHYSDIATTNINRPFDRFPFRSDRDDLRAWQRGETGYPIVDAGMRQLWQTGWMHNRVRLIAGSFLVKHLLIDWREGARWFADTLCDIDPANNAVSWQWVAGSGADAAPFFRIFNPVLQGERFDPAGDYVRRFVPALADLPARFIHRPWDAPEPVRAAAGLKLGTTYPAPIVDHGTARARALAAFATMRG